MATLENRFSWPIIALCRSKVLQNGEDINLLLFVIKSLFCLFLVAVLHRFYCNILHITAHMIYYLGLDARKPDIVVWKTTKVQTSLHICTVWAAPLLLAFRKVNWLHFLYPNFKILANLCSWTGLFEPYVVTNPEDRFSRIEMDSKWDISAQ